MKRATSGRDIIVPVGHRGLSATLDVPADAAGLILFAHGSGSSRHSPRNRYVASVLQEAGFATLLMDLLTLDEERLDAHTGHLRFDIDLLADRLVSATDWLERHADVSGLPVGYFGASTGAAAALVAAARRPRAIRAVVSRGGRPDLAGNSLASVHAATLLIVGGADRPVIALNQQAFKEIAAIEKRLEIVPGASHLFEERGALEAVAVLARDWFARHFVSAPMCAWGRFEVLAGSEAAEARNFLLNRFRPLMTTEFGQPSHGIPARSSADSRAIFYRIRLHDKTGRFERDKLVRTESAWS